MDTDNQKSEPAWKSPWLWGMAGLICVVLTANAIMVYVAITTSSGLVTKDYYERGKNFVNRTKIEFIKREALGWKLNLSFTKEMKAGAPVTFQLSVTTATGPGDGPESAMFFAYRPSDISLDFSAPMIPTGNGNFSADVLFSAKGAWDIIVEVKKGDGQDSIAQRIYIAE